MSARSRDDVTVAAWGVTREESRKRLQKRFGMVLVLLGVGSCYMVKSSVAQLVHGLEQRYHA
jgi:hypothetical protein